MKRYTRKSKIALIDWEIHAEDDDLVPVRTQNEGLLYVGDVVDTLAAYEEFFLKGLVSFETVQEWSAAAKSGRILPWAPGDVIYFQERADCDECEFAEDCEHDARGTPSGFHIITEKCPVIIRELVIEDIRVFKDGEQIKWEINDTYEFQPDDLSDIKTSRAEVEAMMKESEDSNG